MQYKIGGLRETLITLKKQRLLRIAEETIIHQKPLSVSKISMLNNCSERTAYEDIDDCLSHAPEIFIEYSNGHLQSDTTHFSDLISFKSYLLYSEPWVQILISIAFNPHCKTVDCSVALNVSEGFIRREIRRINEVISKFNVWVDYSQVDSTYFISGKTEGAVILFISHLVVISGHDHLIKEPEIETTQEIEHLINTLNIVPSTFINFERRVFSYITDLRIQQGFLTSIEKELTQPIMRFLSVHQQSLKKTINESLDYYDIHLNQQELNKLFAVLNLFAVRLHFNSQCLNQFINRYQYFYLEYQSQFRDIIQYYEDFIESISQNTEIPFKEYKEEIFFHLFNKVLVHKQNFNYTIGVYSDLSVVHESALIHIFNHSFKQLTFLHFNKQTKFDFIISTTSDIITDYPLVIIADFPTAKDMFKVFEMIAYKI